MNNYWVDKIRAKKLAGLLEEYLNFMVSTGCDNKDELWVKAKNYLIVYGNDRILNLLSIYWELSTRKFGQDVKVIKVMVRMS